MRASNQFPTHVQGLNDSEYFDTAHSWASARRRNQRERQVAVRRAVAADADEAPGWTALTTADQAAIIKAGAEQLQHGKGVKFREGFAAYQQNMGGPENCFWPGELRDTLIAER